MKKIIFLGAVALFGVMNAQSTKFGIKGGYSLSTLQKESDILTTSSDGKSTYYVGGLVEHKLNNKFALQGEILYSLLGGWYSMSRYSSEFLYNYEADIKLATLQVPLMAKFYFTENIALAGGVNLGFILSADEEWTAKYLSLTDEMSTYSVRDDMNDEIGSVNFAPFIGAEYNLGNGLFVDARYNIGVSNLNSSGLEDELLKVGFFQAGLGYKF